MISDSTKLPPGVFVLSPRGVPAPLGVTPAPAPALLLNRCMRAGAATVRGSERKPLLSPGHMKPALETLLLQPGVVLFEGLHLFIGQGDSYI